MALDAPLSDALLSARRQISRLADSSLGSLVRRSAGERRDETEPRVMDCAEAVSRGRRPLLALNYRVGIIHRHLRRDNNGAISAGPAPWGFYRALVRAVQCAASSRHLWAFLGGGFVKSSDRLLCFSFF